MKNFNGNLKKIRKKFLKNCKNLIEKILNFNKLQIQDKLAP